MGRRGTSIWKTRTIRPVWPIRLLCCAPLTGLVVLDEIQTRPDLFPLLRVLADRPESPPRFLLLGSAAAELLRHTAQTLAGRVALHELDGLALDEIASVETGAGWLDTRYMSQRQLAVRLRVSLGKTNFLIEALRAEIQALRQVSGDEP